MKNRIELMVSGGQWVAKYVGPHAADIRSLFGADTLPTPFTSAASADRVVSQISASNRGIEVVVK